MCALTDFVGDVFGDRRHAVASFMDLSKAFDCVNYEKLVGKLYCYDFHPSSCRMLASYLGNRCQYVGCGDSRSGISFLSRGVPQGSVLGPLLFNVYVNDFPSQVNVGSILFADDTTIFHSDCSLAAARDRVSVEFG